MRKKIPSLITILLFILALFTAFDMNFELTPTVRGATIYVPNDYLTIQEAVDAAWPGDIVYVYNGTYNENVIIDKTINLTGESRDTTIVQGGGIGDVLNISADWVNVTGFSVTGSGSGKEDAGLELFNVQNVEVVYNKIFNNNNGIILRDCNGNTINSNIAIMNSDFGIYLYSCSGNNIIGNNVSANTYGGILLEISTNNNIKNNTASFMTNFNGIHLSYSNFNTISFNEALSNDGDGIHLWWSDGNTISGNIVSSNYWYGIFLWKDCDGNVIKGNTADNNTHGINLYEYCDNNVITNNKVSINDIGILIMDMDSLNNKIYHNIFLDNMVQAAEDPNNGNNQWDNGYPSGGNYWSDYTGPDNNDDGIGDIPYYIGVNSKDNYPLMKPVGNYILLHRSWNLISIPLIQSDTNLDIVLNSIKGMYDSVQWYNASDITDQWKHNHSLKPSHLNDLDNIDHTMGFWIHIIDPDSVLFQYSGIQLTENQSITLRPGWNLVGYPSLTNYNRTEGLNNLTFGSEVDSILTYDAPTQNWEEIGPSDYFECGKGYWVHAKTNCIWEVPL